VIAEGSPALFGRTRVPKCDSLIHLRNIEVTFQPSLARTLEEQVVQGAQAFSTLECATMARWPRCA